MNEPLNNDIEKIFKQIKILVNSSKNKIYSMVNTEMLNLYWNIGKIIMKIQDGEKRAKYGDKVLEELSIKLTKEFGKGFSIRNLRRMRKFYSLFEIRTTLMSELSWSHYLELIKINDNNKRNFYMLETINSKWSVRELQRQRDSLLSNRK